MESKIYSKSILFYIQVVGRINKKDNRSTLSSFNHITTLKSWYYYNIQNLYKPLRYVSLCCHLFNNHTTANFSKGRNRVKCCQEFRAWSLRINTKNQTWIHVLKPAIVESRKPEMLPKRDSIIRWRICVRAIQTWVFLHHGNCVVTL